MHQPSLPYNLLKFALQMFAQAPSALAVDEHEKVRQRAEAECLLQAKVLTSPEGMQVVVPAKSVDEAMAALAGRYASAQAFEEDLAANDLGLSSMAAALEVELAVEATLAMVAAQVEGPDAAQVAAACAKAEKEQPERRRLRHILITINDQFPENSRPAALARITKVRAQALEPGADFSALAQRYSECPTALQGGAIGPVERGGLYDSLADTLFVMAEGEISQVVESSMGFHVLCCDAIIPAAEFVPPEMRAAISKDLHDRARKRAVQAWLAAL